MQLTELAAKSRALGCEAEESARMEHYTSFKIGGPADLLITAPGIQEIKTVWSWCKESEIPVFLLGNGTNILVSDVGIRGAVLRMSGSSGQPEIKDGLLSCPAGIPLKRLCQFARDNGFAGLEFAYGIPGTVGGAVYMNAGAYGGQLADVLEFAEAVAPDGSIPTIHAADMELRYRHSVFMENRMVVVSAAFRLKPDDKTSISERMEEFMRRRREKQPLEYPSAGSFFKRPQGYYAGTLIESCGLKGYTVGGAQVSEKHAGFLINRGGATCSDVLRLSDSVRDRVWREHGVQLEPEVRFVGISG